MKRKNLFKVLALAMAMAQPVGLFAQKTVGGGTDAASVASPYGKSASRTQHDADQRGPSSTKAANARHKAPGDVVSYGISFGEAGSETMVTSENYTNISAANGFNAIKSGTVTFDRTTNTLTLKDAVITAPVRYDKEKSNIETSLFTLRLEGQNEITSRGASVAIANGDAVIEGPGSLKTSSEKDCGIYVRGNHTFEIRNTGQMELEGRWGISGPLIIEGNLEGNLKITNANVKVKGREGSICDLSSIELTDCKITSPAGATIDGGAVKLNGNVCTEEVVIARTMKYGIRIGGVEVTEDNYQDISAAGGFPAVKSGEVTYNPITNELLLRNAVVERTIIYTGTEKFNIYLRGMNSISDESNDALNLKAATTIMGSGSLKCSGAGCGIYSDGNHILEISNESGIETEGKWGIAGRDGSVGTLKLTNARVKARGRNGSICDFKTITLEGCEIDAPAGAVIEGGAVKLNGNVCTEEVVIAPFEKKYGIRIGGVEVTTKNYLDISAAGGFPAVKNGLVAYYPEDNTLTLIDAVVEGKVYYDGTDKLNINPLGENSVSDASQAAIHLFADALIYGPGSLKCSAPYDCGIYLDGQHTLEIKNQGGIEAEGRWGITGNNRAEGRLIINGARVKARGTRGSICDFEAITLKDCRMQEPAGAVIDGGSVKLGGSVCTEEVLIVPFEKYRIWIGDEQLMDVNYQDISPTGGFPAVKSGKVTYDPETNTLTLKDAVVEGRIWCRNSEKLYIDLEGENSVSYDTNTIYIGYDATIKGTGSLKCKCSSKKYAGILFGGDSLEIRNNGGIEVEGKYGIAGHGDPEANLKLINAQVKARGTDGSICNFKTITLEGCEIVSPAGAVIEGGNVMLNGNVCMEEVVIAPAEKKYGIRIGGVEVTKANYQDISAAGGFPAVKSGKVTYNPDTGTLTLTDGTSVEANGTHGIHFYNREATHALELKGESKVTTTGTWMCALSTSGSLLVNGGKCLFQATEECAMEARDGGRLEITNCDIEALGGSFGLCGDTHKETLLVSRSNIRAQGSQFSLAYFKEISLTDCQLTEPTGAVIEGGDVKLGGEITNQTVVITSSGFNAIRDIASEGKRPAGAIYSLSGQRIRGDRNNLPRGIYIMKGKKVVIN